MNICYTVITHFIFEGASTRYVCKTDVKSVKVAGACRVSHSHEKGIPIIYESDGIKGLQDQQKDNEMFSHITLYYE